MLEKMIEDTRELNMVADRLRARGEIQRLQELGKEWLISEKEVQDFLEGKRIRLAEIPLEEKKFRSPSGKINEEMYQFEGPGIAVALGQYLLEHCDNQILAAQILLPHKSLEKGINFVMEKVYDESKDYLQGAKNGQKGVGVAVSSEKVYRWLDEYYALDDEEKERKKKEEEKERKRRLQEKPVMKLENHIVKEKIPKQENQLSLFDLMENKE